ncbi:hypothetical protein WJ968_08125 [Achromobacter xylosoxidans]
MTQLMNLNANYTSETVTQAPVGKLFVVPDGSSARYDMTENWFCVNDLPRCGKEVALLENDSQHGFLMPSDAYPASRYGPPLITRPGTRPRTARAARKFRLRRSACRN